MLTKQQRLEAYMYARTIFSTRNDKGFGVCFWIDRWGMDNLSAIIWLEDVPEFRNQMPSGAYTGGLWWPKDDTASRLRALERAIAECEAAQE